MPNFRYKAYKASGGTVTGTVSADSAREAGDRLKKDGLYPVEIALQTERGRTFGKRIALPELALMTRRLATLSASGIPVFEAVTALFEQEPEGELKNLLGRLREKLAEGASLARAMGAEPVFGESYVGMVAAGEAGGALEPVLERLADFLEDRQAIRGKITTALAYPMLMMLVGGGVMIFLLTFVIPKIVVIFEENKGALPLITRALIAVSYAIRKWWWVAAGAAAGVALLYRRYSREETFLRRRDGFLLRLPVAGPLIREMVLSRFSRVLGLLLKSGVPMLKSLDIAAEVAANREYREAIAHARDRVGEGASLASALPASLFPPLLLHMVAVGEKSGNLEDMLLKAGRSFETELERSITRMMSLLEPVMVLAMGLAVGGVVVAVLLPIMELNQLVK